MDNLVSESARKTREAAVKSNNLNWLNGVVDMGAVVAADEKQANDILKSHVTNDSRLPSASQAKATAISTKSRAFYITGVYGKPETLRVGDCIINCDSDVQETAPVAEISPLIMTSTSLSSV